VLDCDYGKLITLKLMDCINNELGILLIQTLKKLFDSTKDISTISSGCISISSKITKYKLKRNLCTWTSIK